MPRVSRSRRASSASHPPSSCRSASPAATGQPFKLLRVGGLWVLGTLIKVTKALMPTTNEVFPPWQGLQYLHNMFTGRPKFDRLDNSRYPDIRWTSVREVLQTRK